MAPKVTKAITAGPSKQPSRESSIENVPLNTDHGTVRRPSSIQAALEAIKSESLRDKKGAVGKIHMLMKEIVNLSTSVDEAAYTIDQFVRAEKSWE